MGSTFSSGPVPVLFKMVDVHNRGVSGVNYFGVISTSPNGFEVIGKNENHTVSVEQHTILTLTVYYCAEPVFAFERSTRVGALRIPVARLADQYSAGLFQYWLTLDTQDDTRLPPPYAIERLASEFERNYKETAGDVYKPKVCVSLHCPSYVQTDGKEKFLHALTESHKQLTAYVATLHQSLPDRLGARVRFQDDGPPGRTPSGRRQLPFPDVGIARAEDDGRSFQRARPVSKDGLPRRSVGVDGSLAAASPATSPRGWQQPPPPEPMRSGLAGGPSSEFPTVKWSPPPRDAMQFSPMARSATSPPASQLHLLVPSVRDASPVRRATSPALPVAPYAYASPNVPAPQAFVNGPATGMPVPIPLELQSTRSAPPIEPPRAASPSRAMPAQVVVQPPIVAAPIANGSPEKQGLNRAQFLAAMQAMRDARTPPGSLNGSVRSF